MGQNSNLHLWFQVDAICLKPQNKRGHTHNADGAKSEWSTVIYDESDSDKLTILV